MIAWGFASRNTQGPDDLHALRAKSSHRTHDTTGPTRPFPTHELIGDLLAQAERDRMTRLAALLSHYGKVA